MIAARWGRFSRSYRCRLALVEMALAWSLIALQAVSPAAVAQSANSTPTKNLTDYRQHLESLDALVAACQKQRSAEACDPKLVGPDERVSFSTAAEPRAVGYEWLRDLLQQAGKKAEPNNVSAVVKADLPPAAQKQPELPRPPTLDQLLTQAHERLSADWKQAGETPSALSQRSAERQALSRILSAREYQGVTEVSVKDRFLENLGNWLNLFFSKLFGLGERSPWIGWLFWGVLLTGVCLTLVWALVRIERRSRLRLVPDSQPDSMAPSARAWQLWMQDARSMASQELWREAIHFVYWASISRLESRRLWPADRTRTPREYLSMLAGDDPRKTSLIALTRSFERTWYGGRPASAAEFQTAVEIAAALGVE